MTDRVDPSQYPEEIDFNAFNPQNYTSTFDDESPLQDRQSGFADARDLVDYPQGPSEIESDRMFREYAHLFYTQVAKVTKTVSVSRPMPSGGGIMSSGKGLITGFNLHETTGAAGAFIKVHDGMDASYSTLFYISLAAGESTRDYMNIPVRFTRGLYVEIVSGNFEGNIFTSEEKENV